MRKEVKTNELAENASDQQNLNKEKQNDEADGEIEMDNKDNAFIEIIDDSSAKEMSNVFLNITERQNVNYISYKEQIFLILILTNLKIIVQFWNKFK